MCSMICAKTSLPWFIGGPRDGRHHGLANAPIRVEIETRSKHELSFTNQTVIAPLVLDVGTALTHAYLASSRHSSIPRSSQANAWRGLSRRRSICLSVWRYG